jgi:cytochrome c oxidase subunit IV
MTDTTETTTATPPRDTSSWRSFALFGFGLLVLLGAAGNLVATEGGHGAMRWVLIAFMVVVASLAAGLAIDWRRLDWLTRAVQTIALALSLVMIVGVWIYFPDVLRMMW